MDPACPVDSGKSHLFLEKGGYVLYRCESCAVVFVHPQPAPSFLKKEVYSFESGYQANKEKDLSKVKMDKKTERILTSIKKNSGKGRLLDVGCSNGEFLYLAKKEGFETFGVELNKRTADIATANGLTVFNGLLVDAPYAAASFDSIYLGDIIEHVTSPQEFIDQCKRFLKPSGVIVISTPNLDCPWSKMTFLWYRLFSIPWSSVTPPHHLFQFSTYNLNLLMEKEGFSCVDVWYKRQPRLMYELGSLHLLKRWKQHKRIRDLFFMTFAFALYTITYAVAMFVNLFVRKNFAMIATYKYD